MNVGGRGWGVTVGVEGGEEGSGKSVGRRNNVGVGFVDGSSEQAKERRSKLPRDNQRQIEWRVANDEGIRLNSC
jgi:hypothetical protein